MEQQHRSAHMPSDESDEVGVFDRFASATSRLVSRAPFFALAVGLVVLWLIEGIVIVIVTGDPAKFIAETYQLQINTLTTIVTFLLVALLQNTQTRADKATQEKLNAIADALADLMRETADEKDGDDLEKDAKELSDAVGLEEHVSADDK
jgi:low affinity Fe/Cu permease